MKKPPAARPLQRFAAKVLVVAAVVFAALALPTASSAGADDSCDRLAASILSKACIRVGVCEMPRAGDGRLAVSLARAGVTLVHALAADATSTDAARRAAEAEGLLGIRVMIESATPSAIPLADWLADLVVLADVTDANLQELDPAEIRRVLSPYRGVAIVGLAQGAGGALGRSNLEKWAAGMGVPDVKIVSDPFGLWAVVRMPPLEGADGWTHFMHDAGNNPVSTDTVLKPPYQIQYISPPFVSPGGSSRVAGGRMFEAIGQKYKFGQSVVGRLWCRNAYNGQLLWETKLSRHIEAKQPVMVATAGSLYVLDEDRPGVQVIDPESGSQRRVITFEKGSGQCKWIAVDGNTLFALVGAPAPPLPEGATYHGGAGGVPVQVMEGKLNHGTRIYAYDLKQDAILWQHRESSNLIDCRAIGTAAGRLCFLAEDRAYQRDGSDELVKGIRVACLDARTGQLLWENKGDELQLGNLVRQYLAIFGREYFPGLICTAEGIRLRLIGVYRNDILVFSPQTGKLLWKLDRNDKNTPGSFSGFIRDGKYYHGGFCFDLHSGKLSEQKLPWDGGCGVRTWAPAGVFGNYNADSVGMTVKSDCHGGSFVAGGLLHVPRGWCNCDRVWRGTFAFASRGSLDVEQKAGPECLQRSPDAGRPVERLDEDEADWPTYRGNIPPAFDDDLLIAVPGGWDRYYQDGKRVESSVRPHGTQGLLALERSKVLALASAAVSKSKGFEDKHLPCQTWTLQGEAVGRRTAPGNYSEMLRKCSAFRWQFENPFVQVNAVVLAKNAVVITRGILETDAEKRLVDAYARWTVAGLSRTDGRILWEHDLPCEPMLNGLCIDRGGRVIVALREGGVTCVGEDSPVPLASAP